MRNLKKFLALVLAMVMAFSLMVTANAASDNVTYPDSDVVLDQFEDAVTVLSGMGVLRGNNGSFKPQDKIMRCEAVAILYRLVTSDVKDTQVDLYKPLATSFSDVKETDWFAGYVGFAVDAKLINGYNGRFMPYENVTGYEMLKMLLKAVGYGQNGEYTGAQWRINVGSDAQRLGILTNINSTHYANTLAQKSPREVVADLTFQTAAYVPTVRYELGYYNPWVGVASGQGGNIPNPTLGEREFGLTKQTGIVVGNQATGEDYTLVGVVGNVVWDTAFKGVNLTQTGSYVYATDTTTTVAATTQTLNVTLNYNFGTGLDYFGHKVDTWYDSRTSLGTQQVGGTATDQFASAGYNKTYAILDKATLVANVYSEDAVLSVASPTGANDKLAVAAAAAGFKVQPDSGKSNPSTTHFSDRYSQMGALAANGTANISPVSMYALVSNNDNLTVDAAIALSIEVAQIRQKNTTAATPYLVLGSNTANTSTFGNGTTAGTINLKQLTPDTQEAQKTIGARVTAYEVAGTGETLTSAAGKNTNGDADFMYQLDPMKTVTKTVANYKADSTLTLDTSYTPVVTEVNFTDGTSMKLSGITRGLIAGNTSEIISGALPIVTALAANTSYTVYEDIVGRFISITSGSDYKFLYGTYADFAVGGLGTGTIGYNMVGVDWDAKIQGENTLNSIEGPNNPINGTRYNTLTTTRKDYGTDAGTPGTNGGNQLLGGYDTGYMYNANTGDLTTNVFGATMFTGTSTGVAATAAGDLRNWVITSTDAANGFARVKNHNGTSDIDYLLTKDTQFIIVSGTGTASLKVEVADGLTGLLAGGTSAEIAGSFGWDASASAAVNNNQVWFQTDAELYGTVNTGNNGVITKVILSDANLTRFNTQSLFFNFDATADTGMVLPGTNSTNVKQYELWNNGQRGFYFVDSTAAGSVAPTTAETFYTLAKIDEVNGTPIYKAVAQTSATNLSYAEGFNSDAGNAGATVTYTYVTVTNLETGLFTKGTGSLVFDITKATVCDVDWAKTAGESAARSEITNVLELNNAVSVKNVNPATPVYGIEVAVVYDGVGMTTIYVTDVT